MADENPNVERLRAVYGRWGQGDITPTELFHPDIEVIWALRAAGIEGEP